MVPCFKGVIVGLKMYITLSLKDGLYLLELYDGYRLFVVCLCSRFVCIDFKPWCGLGWRPLTLGVAPGEGGIVTVPSNNICRLLSQINKHTYMKPSPINMVN